MIPTLFQIGLIALAFLAGTKYEKVMMLVRERRDKPYSFLCQVEGCMFRIDGNRKDGIEMVAKDHMRTIHAEL